MAEYGFYHPIEGYWQAVSEVPEHIRASYPEGTVEVPLRPASNFIWDGSTWVEGQPIAEPIPTSITFAQLLIGLVAEGWITEAQGDGWLAGTLPDPVIALISTLPQEQRFAAKARALRPSEVLRADPLVVALGSAQGKTPEDLDVFFRTYASV